MIRHIVFRRPEVTALSTLEWAMRYRCMQLLQREANVMFKHPYAAAKVLFLLAAIRCLYGLVRMNGYMRVLNGNSALCYVVFLVVFFEALGAVFDLSEKVLLQQTKNIVEQVTVGKINIFGGCFAAA